MNVKSYEYDFNVKSYEYDFNVKSYKYNFNVKSYKYKIIINIILMCTKIISYNCNTVCKSGT